jgi:ubiquinone/menaquinone biosynthesis C-methylase UbiE
LVAILHRDTDLFGADTKVIEVAPMRGFQQYCLQLKGNKNYISFDITRFAMERGDITQMRFPDASTDYFLCFHVLEHINEDDKALDEIRRVLRPRGCAILQVPIDWESEKTVEYSTPNPRETNHVRRYGKDFGEKIATHDFDVTSISVTDFFSQYQIEHYGLSKQPIFFAKKP